MESHIPTVRAGQQLAEADSQGTWPIPQLLADGDHVCKMSPGRARMPEAWYWRLGHAVLAPLTGLALALLQCKCWTTSLDLVTHLPTRQVT